VTKAHWLIFRGLVGGPITGGRFECRCPLGKDHLNTMARQGLKEPEEK